MSDRAWWVAAAAFCVACVATIAWKWEQAVGDYAPTAHQLVDQVAVDAALATYRELSPPDAPVVLVPTGIFVQSVAFVSSSDVNLTGYLWQKYADDLPGDVSRGFVLPERVMSADTVVEEAYRRRGDGYEVVGWYFDVTVREPFDYSRYPLDRHEVWLRLWHRDFDRNVVLVPDLAAYDTTGAADTFGIDSDVVPGGWRIEETHFGYRNADYDTDFGIEGYVGQKHFPELYFDVVMSRNFRDAFVVNVVPLLVVAMLLFGLLMSMTADEARAERFGFTMLDSLAAVSALLFVVILAHIQLREQFPGSIIVYLEYFYLVMYFAIVLVALKAFLFAYGRAHGIAVLYYRDNFFSKVAFWPLVLGSLTAVTVASL